MDYIINVSKHGKYYFSTEKSGGFSFAVGLFEHFSKVFPKKDGYEITINEICISSEEVRTTEKEN